MKHRHRPLALGHLLAYRDFLAHPPPASGLTDAGSRSPGRTTLDRWRARLGEEGRPLDEAEGLALLGDWGVPVVAAEVATSLEEAVAAAERVGWPVALKTAAPGVAHKWDVGGGDLAWTAHRLAPAYADWRRAGAEGMVAAWPGRG